MSDSQSYEEVTVSADGVSVIKRFEADEFPVPAIAFDVRSSREEAVTVRLQDAVPDGVAVEDLGFHPEYGSEHWTVDQEVITFEREVEAGADYTTVYGIRATGTDNIDQFLTEPTIAEVDPPLEADALGVDADDIDVVPGEEGALDDAITGEGEVPGLEDQAEDVADEETTNEKAADDDDDVATLDLDDPIDEGATDEGTADDEPEGVDRELDASDAEPGLTEDHQETADVADGSAAETVAVEGSLAAALAAEIREDNVPEADLTALREALAVEDDAGGSVEARVERIQADVADLRAYTDALEAFLDENGTGQEVVEEAREEIDEFERRLGDLEESVGRVESEVEDAAGAARDAGEAVGTVREDLQDVRADVDEFETELEAVGADLAELEEQVGDEDVAQRVDEMESELEELRDWREQIMETFGG